MANKKFSEIHNEIGVAPISQLINYGYPSKEMGELLGKKPIPFACLYRNETVILYTDLKHWENLGKFIGDKAAEDVEFFRNLFKKSEEFKAETIKIIHELGAVKKINHTNEEIVDLIKKLAHNGFILTVLSQLGAIADHYHNNFSNIMDGVAGKIKNLKLSKTEIVNLLSTPEFLMPSEEAKNELKKIKRLSDKRKKDKEIEGFLAKWHWLHHGHLGPSLTKRDVLGELASDINIKDVKNLIEKQKAIEINFKSKKEKNIFETARIFIYLKGMRMEVCNGIFYFLNLLLKKIEKETGIKKENLYYLTINELIEYFEGKKNFKKKDLIQRRKYSVWIPESPYKLKLLAGKQAKEYIKKFTEKEKIILSKEIKGNTAFPGNVEGTVKIINSANEMKKMKKGDIMVSVQTMPDLLPAMKKAVAFVTDMGGITSHAAIVSREMKVPCIVGTRNATKVLKDGDFVEIDANNGKIKLLKLKR